MPLVHVRLVDAPMFASAVIRRPVDDLELVVRHDVGFDQILQELHYASGE
jgi:hypothetical protein